MLGIEYVAPTKLKANPRNARIHSPKQIRQLARSIQTFRFNVPIIVDAHFQVVAGHGRLLAAQQLGLNEIPIIRLEHLTEDQIRAFALADNKLVENSVWDAQLLAEELKSLAAVDLDFSLEATGFEIGESDLAIESLDVLPEEDVDPARQQASAEQAISKIGDCWQLGRNRVLCADALLARSYDGLMGEKRAAMVFTNPLITCVYQISVAMENTSTENL